MTQTPTDALRLVPVDLTPKMLKAAFAAMNATPSGEWKRMKAENKTPRELFDAKMRPRWSAMLAAAPASPLPGGGLSSDVVRLVIAARRVAYEGAAEDDLRALDIAAEAFASRVPWDDEPDEIPAAPTGDA